MKLSWLGKLVLASFATDVAVEYMNERRASRERIERFHGYSWQQVDDILGWCFQAVPGYLELLDETRRVDPAKHLRMVGLPFTISPEDFERLFRFRRPAPY